MKDRQVAQSHRARGHAHSLSMAIVASVFMLAHPAASFAQECNGQQILKPGKCNGDELDSNEERLASLINQYRLQNNLPAIPLSAALHLVANRHARDLHFNLKTLTHDWSNCPKGDWTCMWQAPQRLGTEYPGMGYENAHGGSGQVGDDVAAILESWKENGDGPHNDVILQKGIFKGKNWQALGIGICEGYAVMWVGEER